MSVPSRARTVAAVFLAFLVLDVATTQAGVLQCQRAITDGIAKFARARTKALQSCEEKIVKDKLAPGTDCTANTIVQKKLAAAESNLAGGVADKCGGKNRTCDAADTGKDVDIALAAVGWNVAACPDFEGAGCTNAITDCGDVTDCLACVGTAAADQAITLYYGALALPSKGIDAALNKCQLALGKSALKFLRKKTVALQKCEGRVRRGASAGPCPDATATEQIAQAEQVKIAGICKACGGADKVCGGGDDFTPTTIGFPPDCPSVTIPGGAACGGAVATLQQLVTCVDCVTEFKADCIDALSVLGVKSYPTECNPPSGPM